MVNVKAVNPWRVTGKCTINALYGENERSPTQDVESQDSCGTQRVVVLREGLTPEDFTFRYTKIICATGAKLLRCKGVGPKRRNASIWIAAPYPLFDAHP